MGSRPLLILFTVLCYFIFSFVCFAEPAPAVASCRISCRVAEIVEWSNDEFPAIDLGELNPEQKQSFGSSSLFLYTNGDVVVCADNSESAELSNIYGRSLKTEYSLSYDFSGVNQTGGDVGGWSSYDSFLSLGSEVRHVDGDGAVEVELKVRVSKERMKAGDGGDYRGVQTLTAYWGS